MWPSLLPMIPPPRAKLSPPPRPGTAVPGPPPRRKAKPTIAIQDSLFGGIENDRESEYVAKIKAPVYEPKNRKPDIIELVNPGLTPKLLIDILKSNVTDKEQAFLTLAAYRHHIFNYQLIADYYSHSSPEMQRLMEASALVIIDFKDALLSGFVKYTEDIADIYTREHDGNKD